MNQSASKTWTREFLTAMAAYVIVLPICMVAYPTGTDSSDSHPLRHESIHALL